MTLIDETSLPEGGEAATEPPDTSDVTLVNGVNGTALASTTATEGTNTPASGVSVDGADLSRTNSAAGGPLGSTLAIPRESHAGTRSPSPSGSGARVPAADHLAVPGKGKTSSPERPQVVERKSMFGKLFNTNSPNPSNSDVGSEKMERGDSGSGVSATGSTIQRKPSKKGKEDKEDKEEKKEKEKSRSRAPSDAGHKMDQAAPHSTGTWDFMARKMQRKGSMSKRSDDGKSEKESMYGSTKGGDHRSQAGTAVSLGKKYGVCEKMAIGKGATAVVKLAHKWDRTTETLYAVKEFRKRRKNETEKEYVKKLTSEFCISSTLHHVNVVETVDLLKDDQDHWCEVMEYCPGGDLYAAIKKGNMSTEEINSFFKQILSGVAYLHSMGVAHRDIKPENLLLDGSGRVKITDFGVSDVFRMCWEKTTHLSKGLCGSEPYIAPEQFDHKEYDARLVDVWACAVVFYCMNFQELPWRVAKTSDPSFGPYVEAYNKSASAPAPLSNLSPRECRAIVKRMLDPDPKTRVTMEQIMADPWIAAIKVI